MFDDFGCEKCEGKLRVRVVGTVAPVLTLALMPCILAISCRCLRGVAAKFTFWTHDGTLMSHKRGGRGERGVSRLFGSEKVRLPGRLLCV